MSTMAEVSKNPEDLRRAILEQEREARAAEVGAAFGDPAALEVSVARFMSKQDDA